MFITFEGTEGSGKSTQARRLYECVQGAGYRALLTKEPGGTPIGDLIRQILFDFQHQAMEATTETLLFAAARAQHVAERIRPWLLDGGVVICDRFVDSTYAYQGYGLGRDMDELRMITRVATDGLMPALTLFLDVPVEVGLRRKRAVPQQSSVVAASPSYDDWNRLDAREHAFHERVHRGYHALLEAEPARWRRLDGQQDPDRLASEIWHIVEPELRRLA